MLLATDLVDFLVKKGEPFREAHHAVGFPDVHGAPREDVGEAETRQNLVQDFLEGDPLQIDPLHAGIQVRIKENVVVRPFSSGSQEVLEIRVPDRHGDPLRLGLGSQPLATARRGGDEQQGEQQARGVLHGVSGGFLPRAWRGLVEATIRPWGPVSSTNVGPMRLRV